MATEVKLTNYWISSSALYIQLNAMGEPNYIQCSVASGASILCYMQDIEGLGYDAGHNYQRWPLVAYPSLFPDAKAKSVYVAIPRVSHGVNGTAMVVFPSERIDIYGKSIASPDKQVGNEDYYYVYLQGEISEVLTKNVGKDENDQDIIVKYREWTHTVEYGSLATDEAIASGGEGQWWRYESVHDTIKFLKTISVATFTTLKAATATIATLFLNGHKIVGVATENTDDTSANKVVTPEFLGQFGVRHFLSKENDDTVNGMITFIKGLVSEALVKLNGGAYFGKEGALIDEAGRAILESLQSIDYDNEAEQGFAVKKEKNGKYHAFITNLTIWGKAIFNQLDVRKLSYAGGNVYLSGAGSKIVKAVPVYRESESSEWLETTVDMCEGWLCYLLADDGTTATQNLWREGDQVRCKTIGTLATGTMNASNKSYWRTIPTNGVSSVNEKIYDGYGNELYGGQMFSWIVLGKHSVAFDGGDESSASAEIAGVPEAGDTIVLDGSRNDTTRQGVLILESTGENTPRIVGFKGVNRYTHENKEVFVLSPDRISLNSGIFEWVSPSGDAMHMVNYRGEWKAGSYDYYDQVNHNNALWTCINENGTSQEPSDASSDWQKVLSGEKGEKGEQGIKGDKGEDGAKGTDGEDAISILVEDAPLVFDTDDSGTVPASAKKTAKVKVMKGNTNVTDDCTELSSRDDLNSNCMCSVEKDEDNGCISVSVQGNWISKNDVIVDGVNQGQVSATSGYAVAQFVYAGVAYFAQVPFSVNVSKYMGSVKATAQGLLTQYTKLVRDLSSPSPSTLTQYTSAIQQTAKDIVLSVNKKKAGRRNLLYGTAFRQDGLIDCNPHFQPTMTEGMNGMNAVRFSVTASDSFQYYGLFWRGEYGNIPVKRNTDYTFSCWVKCDNPHAMLYTERHSMSDATTSKRGTAIPLSKGDVWWRNDGNWQLVTNTFNSGNTDFVEINIFLFNGDENSKPTLNAQAWFCMPMLEEGLEYTGWTLSERDSDYVGGNMLDDTRTLVASGQLSNLHTANEVAQDTYEGAYAVVHGKADSSNNNACDVLRFNGEGGRNLDLGQGKNYVFSFLAKGNGTLVAYMYKDSVHASIYSENSQGYVLQSVPDGRLNFTLTSQWKRYWVHWRIDPYTGDGDTVLPQSVLLRAVDGCEAWVTKPKLEEGALMTEYTEKKTDLIDKSTAKAAGLNITSSGVTLYGEKIKVENTLSTGQTTTAALFTDGAINAALILAQMLTSQGLNGQMVRIADGLINIYGKAGTANIRFGLNSSGQAVLAYYDDNGNFLYDLGPAGIASLSKTDAEITSKQYIKAEDAGLTTPLGENVDLPWVNTTKTWYTATKDNDYILFVKGATGKKTTLYHYSAPRVNGKIVADSANGFDTYDLASAADGRTFTSRTMVKNGALTNLADGVFLTADATVYDNTKLLPAIKRGQSVTRPAFFVQISSFSARFTTPAFPRSIYSIQTETFFGNFDAGIM